MTELTVIGPDGHMNEAGGELAGLTQDEAEERILAWIRERDLLVERKAYRHTITLCERCKSRIEPLISLQWWCRMDELKQPALAALREDRVRYHPSSQHRYAIESLESAPDWNISRQIWWGHQLPVWECPDGHVTVEETEPAACAECGSTELTRSQDVLDTWFSSALWPFSTLGWPEETPELETWYPGTLNTTAREIIRLWENRMIFSGLELMGDVPFKDVVIHSLVHAPTGGRMSKSLGTGMNPLALIDQFGADAGQRRFEISLDIVGERLERRNIDDLGLVFEPLFHTLPHQRVDGAEEGSERLARPRRRGDEDVLPCHNGRPSVGLRGRGRAEAFIEPPGNCGMEIG
jgi:valyl-tRNA synthetase